MAEFNRGDKVIVKSRDKSKNRIGVVERMEDTPPGAPRRVVVAGVSHPVDTVALLVSPWDPEGR